MRRLLPAKYVFIVCTPSNQPEDRMVLCPFRLMELFYSAEQQGLLFFAHGKLKLRRLVQTFQSLLRKKIRWPGENRMRDETIYMTGREAIFESDCCSFAALIVAAVNSNRWRRWLTQGAPHKEKCRFSTIRLHG